MHIYASSCASLVRPITNGKSKYACWMHSIHIIAPRIVSFASKLSTATTPTIQRDTTESVVIFYVGYFTMFMRKYILNVRIALAQKTIWIFFLCAIFLYRKSHCRFKVFIVMRHKKKFQNKWNACTFLYFICVFHLFHKRILANRMQFVTCTRK